MSSLLEQGAAALRAGDKARGRACLTAAVAADPADARAWLWLSGALDDPAEQRYCLERAAALDPASAAARRGLAALEGVVARAPALGQAEAAAGAGRATEQRPAAPIAASERPTPGASVPPSGAGAWLGAGLAGASALLAWAAWRGLGALVGPWELLALALLAGLPTGWSALLISGVLLRMSGRWLGGGAGAAQVRGALGRAARPAAAGLVLWAAQLALLPAASFAGAADPAQGLLVRGLAALHGALWGWAALWSVAALARAHGISRARAAGSWLLACLIVVAALVVVFGGSALIIALRGG